MNNMAVGEVREGYRCVKSDDCNACAFNTQLSCMKKCNTFGYCSPLNREDGNAVIFEAVNE